MAQESEVRSFSSRVRSRSSRSNDEAERRRSRRRNEETNERKKGSAREKGKKEKGEKGKETGEKKKWKTGPVRPRSWKRRREMPVSIIPETMTDRHRYSAGNARTRDDDDDDDGNGDTLTPGINLSKNERRGGHERRQLGIPSSFAYVLLQPGNDAGRRSMDGIEGNGFFLAPSFPTPCLVAAATTAPDGRYATVFRFSIDLGSLRAI